MGLGFLSGLFGGGKKESAPAPLPVPSAPEPVDANANAQDKIKQRKAATTQSIYTSPLGVKGTADVATKTLTGQ